MANHQMAKIDLLFFSICLGLGKVLVFSVLWLCTLHTKSIDVNVSQSKRMAKYIYRCLFFYVSFTLFSAKYRAAKSGTVYWLRMPHAQSHPSIRQTSQELTRKICMRIVEQKQTKKMENITQDESEKHLNLNGIISERNKIAFMGS